MGKKKTEWTQFWDMSSGGSQKLKWKMIYIEAPREEAEIIFQNRFGRNPNRVTCTCCGSDYSIDTHEDLAQLTGYHRGCQVLETPRNPKTKLFKNDDPVIKKKLYLEKNEKPPKGYKLSSFKPLEKYQTLEEYTKNSDVCVVYEKDIKPSERKGELNEEGYVWR